MTWQDILTQLSSEIRDFVDISAFAAKWHGSCMVFGQ
jgi:hypothetical protein